MQLILVDCKHVVFQHLSVFVPQCHRIDMTTLVEGRLR